jgi:hypothetical protein
METCGEKSVCLAGRDPMVFLRLYMDVLTFLQKHENYRQAQLHSHLTDRTENNPIGKKKKTCNWRAEWVWDLWLESDSTDHMECPQYQLDRNESLRSFENT